MNHNKQTAIIELEKMEIYAYHGCYKEEQVVGNKFIVHITLETDVTLPAASDKIKDALNYVEVYDAVREEMKQTSHLLEHVTARILDRLFQDFPAITHATVKVSKMNPPMGGQMKAVSITLRR